MHDEKQGALGRTPLFEAHRRLGAKMVPFAGFEMPVQYAGLLEEHRAVREAAGVFDVSHMGEIEVRGPRALETLNHILTNDLSKCAVGQAMYSVVCRPDGGIVDDVVAYRRGDDDFLVCVNASNRDKDFAWFREHNRGADMKDTGDAWAQIAVQGPRAREIVKTIARGDVMAIGPFRLADSDVAGVPSIVARTGYTGEDGFEIFCPAAQAERVWNAILEAGAPDGIAPAGLGARDTLRLEAKLCLYGNDIDDTTSPLDAGLGWVVKLAKPDFIGKAVLEKQKAEGVKSKLVGFTLEDKGIPRSGYSVLRGGQKVGRVTSGTLSPTLKMSIGLAYVPPDLASVGSHFDIDIRGRAVPARVVETPFYKRA